VPACGSIKQSNVALWTRGTRETTVGKVIPRIYAITNLEQARIRFQTHFTVGKRWIGTSPLRRQASPELKPNKRHASKKEKQITLSHITQKKNACRKNKTFGFPTGDHTGKNNFSQNSHTALT
jgi:hypothetical protein